MQNEDVLRQILDDLTIALSESGERDNIRLRNDDELGAIDPSGQITINPEHAEILEAKDKITEKQEFALIVNTESHELEHRAVTKDDLVKSFSEEYKGKRPRLAGYVVNVLEDVYIDKRRTERDMGLKPVQSLFADLIRKKSEPITELNPPQKHATALLQIGKAGGSPVGFEDVEDEEFKEYCARARQFIDEARNTHIQSERIEIAHQVMDLIEEYAGSLDCPELELPPFMVRGQGDMSEEGDGDPLPQANPNTNENESEEGEGGEEGEGFEGNTPNSPSQNGAGENSSGEQNPTCPKCGSEDNSKDDKLVDWEMAARYNAPVNQSQKGVKSVEFISDDKEKEEGVCGFRVVKTASFDPIDEDKIESMGYIRVSLNQDTDEILEPKSRYDDEERIDEYTCQECGHRWIPGVGT